LLLLALQNIKQSINGGPQYILIRYRLFNKSESPSAQIMKNYGDKRFV